jgi:hypothetical protein
MPASPHELVQKNTAEFPQAFSLFYTGKIADELGAFLQLTWNPPSNSIGIESRSALDSGLADPGPRRATAPAGDTTAAARSRPPALLAAPNAAE